MKDHKEAIQLAATALTLAPEDFGCIVDSNGRIVITDSERQLRSKIRASLKAETLRYLSETKDSPEKD